MKCSFFFFFFPFIFFLFFLFLFLFLLCLFFFFFFFFFFSSYCFPSSSSLLPLPLLLPLLRLLFFSPVLPRYGPHIAFGRCQGDVIHLFEPFLFSYLSTFNENRTSFLCYVLCPCQVQGLQTVEHYMEIYLWCRLFLSILSVNI